MQPHTGVHTGGRCRDDPSIDVSYGKPQLLVSPFFLQPAFFRLPGSSEVTGKVESFGLVLKVISLASSLKAKKYKIMYFFKGFSRKKARAPPSERY